MSKELCKISGQELQHSPLEIEVYGLFDAKPPPLIPNERLRVLLAFQSGGHFFWREVGGRKLYSIYPSTSVLSVVEAEFLTENVNFQEWNLNDSFLQCLFKLLRQSTRPHHHASGVSQTFGVEQVSNINSSSLVLFSADSENCFSSDFVSRSNNIGSSLFVLESQNCLSSIRLENCANIVFSEALRKCQNSYFLKECYDCQECLFCVGLKSARYFIENEFVGEERFKEVLLSLNLDTAEGVELALTRFKKFQNKIQIKEVKQTLCFRTQNSSNTFGTFSADKCVDVVGFSDCISSSALTVASGGKATRLFNCIRCGPNVSDLYYSFDCSESRELLGCVGLKNAEYRVLNKQYTRAEYNLVKEQIISTLRKKRQWGNPLAFKYSDFAYNGSLAHQLFPLSKVQAGMFEVGWDDEVEEFKVERLISSPELIKQIADTPQSLEEAKQSRDGVFVCELSGKLFRYLPGELALYSKLNIFPNPYAHDERKRQLWGQVGEILRHV